MTPASFKSHLISNGEEGENERRKEMVCLTNLLVCVINGNAISQLPLRKRNIKLKKLLILSKVLFNLGTRKEGGKISKLFFILSGLPKSVLEEPCLHLKVAKNKVTKFHREFCLLFLPVYNPVVKPENINNKIINPLSFLCSSDDCLYWSLIGVFTPPA